MQPVSAEDLEVLIKEAKKAGKDVAKLMEAREAIRKAAAPPAGERKEKQTKEGTVVIESTGPAREEDFQ